MKYISKSSTNVGKVRKANEDNLGQSLTPNGHVFVVCDGMGGHVGGAQASFIAVNSILDFFQRETYDNVIQAIDHALSYANEQIYASSLSNSELKGMGTTAVILLIRGEECFIGHVGDSRIYLRSNGKLNRITKDHSFVQTLVDSGIINDDDAESHPKKNQILQALGIAPTVKATICQAPILPKVGDMFLLCSDGLNGMVNDRDIESIMQEDNLMVTSENLITAALNGGGTDNITASLVLIEESEHASSSFVHFNPKSKVNDLISTQESRSGSSRSFKKKIKLSYLIAGGIFLIGAIVAVILLIYKKEDASHSKKSVKENPISQSPSNSDEKSKDKIQPENKESLSDTIHKVIKNETLSKIVNIYTKKYSPGLTVEELRNYNIKKSKLKENEKNSLKVGMELLIPKIPKNKMKENSKVKLFN